MITYAFFSHSFSLQEYQECPRSQKGSPQLACSGPGSCTSPGSAGQHGQQTHMVTVAYTQRYVELIRLVNRQRDTINAQQADLTKVSTYSQLPAIVLGSV